MPKITTTTTRNADKIFETLEARRRFIKATQADIARLIVKPNGRPITRATYYNWITKGTTAENVARIRQALAEFAKPNP
jgi:hypothetical protein